MSAELPEYTFLPWSRRGIATRIDQPDHLGATPDAGVKDRATFTATLGVDADPVPGAAAVPQHAVPQTVALVGPGDIKNLAADVVLRAMPVPGSGDATPGELAYVEFYDEDFPWRYTPASATAEHKLRPWITLLVLAEGEYTVTTRPGEVPILTITDTAPLPPVAETWAWAHVQASGDLGSGEPGQLLDDRVTHAPDLALSRLLSPRKLVPHVGYHGFLVPAFELGRLAGLGTPADPGLVPAQQPAWGSGQPRRFPVLYDWSFRTGALESFEVLARRPKAYRIEADGFGTRAMDISDPGAGVHLPEGSTAPFEGALRPVDFDSRTGFPQSPGESMVDQLAEVVDLAAGYRDPADPDADPGDEDPIVTPPAYAGRHVGLDRVAEATEPDNRWLAELNLDPRNRAAAGLGSQIVRQHDEEYMERAWLQVDQLDAVNQRIREADLAMATSERVFAKHLAGADPDRMLGITSAAQPALRAAGTGDTTSVRGAVDASRVPAAAQAPAFRRITRPARPLMHTLTAAGDSDAGIRFQGGLLERLNEDPATALSTAPPAPDPVLGVTGTLVADVVGAVAQQAPRGRDLLVVFGGEEVRDRRAAGTLATTTLPDITNGLLDRLNDRYPAPGSADVAAIRAEFQALLPKLTAVRIGTTDQPVLLRMDAAAFAQTYGTTVDGKGYLDAVVTSSPGEPTRVAITASPDNAAEFATALSAFTALVQSRPAPAPAAALTAPAGLAAGVAAQLAPRAALPARLATVLAGTGDLTAGLAGTRRLPQVLAYPTFDDPLFEPLRLLSQDYIIPNIANLPSESIAVMVPNARFIESVLAGVNTEFARELLWNEYPTDQRGTYFARFFDPVDAGAARPDDIPAIPGWQADLGSNSPQLSGLLVLVVRAALLVKFPDTIVFAQHGRYLGSGPSSGRALDLSGEVRYPVVSGRLDPDVRLYGFAMTPQEAAGSSTDGGFFFCFLERPGQLRFGLDLDPDDDQHTPPPVLNTWNDLNWKHLQQTGGGDTQILVGPNAALTPTTAGLPEWGRTAAHLASILCQNPVWLARHATDMLPPDLPGGPTPGGGH